MNKDELQAYDASLAWIHVGIILSEWDESLVNLPSSLYEVEARIFEIFGIKLRSEANIFDIRDKLIAITEIVGEDDGTDIKVH